MARPFRFSLQAFEAPSADAWVTTCRRAEELGYDTLFTTDHHFGPGEIAAASGHRPVDVAPISAMTMAAAVTSTMKVGCRVFGVDYHQPVVLAKELATVDFLSKGRLVAAIGAGWVKAEYDGLGIQQDKPSVRIERLSEVIDVLRAHWGCEPIDIKGKHVSVGGFAGAPKPAQDSIPLMIGGGAEKILTLAGQKADIVSFNFNNSAGKLGASSVASATEDETLQKIQWVKDAAGARFADLELEIDGKLLVDGRIANNLPIQLARDTAALPATELAADPNCLSRLLAVPGKFCAERLDQLEARGEGS